MEPEIQQLTGPEGTQFYTVHWKPAGQVVCTLTFCHGFVEHVRRYDHVFRSFAEHGIAVFAYDQRGFGATAAVTKSQGVTSWSQQFADLGWAVEHAATLHPGTPLVVMGHSMGGAVALGFATRGRTNPSAWAGSLDKVTAVVSSSPLLRQSPGVKASSLLVKAGSLVGKVSGKLTMSAAVKPEDVCRDPVVQKAYAKDPLCKQVGSFRGISDMLLGGEALMTRDYANWPAQLPLLVVHGTGDKVTDANASKEFVDKLKAAGKPAEYVPFEGYYHEMHNEPGDEKWVEINAVRDWILDQATKSKQAKL